ncbi:hypothetical protein BH11BAC4_BH11BAC4_22580 [soil metagenome]
MKKCLALVSFVILVCTNLSAQQSETTNLLLQTNAASKKERVYNIRPWIDIPVTAAFAGWSVYGMSVIYGRDLVPVEELNALSIDKINRFDRPIASNYATKAKAASDLFFYGSMPLPLFLLFDRKIRRDGPRVGLLFLETMGTTGVIYTISAMSANRFRPYAYNTDVPLNIRQRGGARNSFFAGHPTVVAASVFFMARVYCDYHPTMKHKWILYMLAGAAAATTGYLRLKAGQHFKTDVITGLVIGPLAGVMIPQLHKNKLLNARLALMPGLQQGGAGFSAFYKLGRK